MRLEIITPEVRVFDAAVSAVRLPGKEGSFQVLEGHAPMISTLKEGEVKIDLVESAKNIEKLHQSLTIDKRDDKVLTLRVKGGVAEIQKQGIVLLAD